MCAITDGNGPVKLVLLKEVNPNRHIRSEAESEKLSQRVAI